MPEPTIDELLDAEAGLDKSFGACVVAILGKLGWIVVILSMSGVAFGWPHYLDLALLGVVLGAYLWFAASVARTAARLGKSASLYLAWILGAPVLASLMGVLLVSTAILGSPLILKSSRRNRESGCWARS